MPLHINFTMYSFFHALTVTINCVLLYFLYKKEFRLPTTTWLQMFIFTVNLWAFFNFLGTLSTDTTSFISFDKFANLLYPMIPVILFFFSLSYTGNKKFLHSPWLLGTLLSVAGTLGILSNFSNLIFDYSQDIQYKYNLTFDAPEGSLFILFVLPLGIIFLASCVFLYKFGKTSKNPDVQAQVKIILAGLLIPILTGIITDAILPLLKIFLPPLSAPLMLITGVSVTYTVLKHGLSSAHPELVASEIIETIPELLIVLDNKLQIRLVNPSTCQYTRFKEEELMWKHISFLLPQDTLSTFLNNIINPLKNDSRINGVECVLQNKELSSLPMDVFGSYIKIGEGSEVFYVLLMSDVSEIKNMNRKLHEKLSEAKKQTQKFEEMNTLMEGREARMRSLLNQINKIHA